MLSRSECFKILGLDDSAGPNAIKRAYRKLAFELHPDLHPDLPNASKRFQELNEAYVMLMQEYANTNFAAGKRQGTTRAGRTGSAGKADSAGGPSGTSRSGSGTGQPGKGAAGDKTRADARKAYQKAEQAQNKERADKADGSGAGDANVNQDADATAGADKTSAEYTDSKRPEGGYTWAGEPSGKKTGKGDRTNTYQAGTRQPSREEILKDLLNDPFARRVFEDIYSHVQHNAGKEHKAPQAPPRPQPKTAPKVPVRARPVRKSALEAVGGKMAGLAGGIKGWLRRQIDDEQTMFLPGESLLPGARLRLKVQQGLSDEKKTIELTLPPEFEPGKPIRLKGLGRRLGNVQGDLYLRIYSNDLEK